MERNVTMGIIKPVLVGTPTTWCSHMVVMTKNRHPCHTKDLQTLNHTPSPFNLAQSVPAE